MTIKRGGTSTAMSLINNVTSYYNHNNGYNKDVEGAYECIPNPILPNKAIDVIPGHTWKLLDN